MSILSLTLNGQEIKNIPRGFFDVSVKAVFDENVQPSISTDEFVFILEARDIILNHVRQGLNNGVGIFEGIPMAISARDSSNNITVFNGILDLQSGLEIQDNIGQVTTAIRQDNGLNQLAELIEPLDYAYLYQIGVITDSDFVDVDYVVTKINPALEIIINLVTIYLLSVQILNSIKDISESSATVAGILAAGLTGSVGAAIYAAASAILEAIYAAAVLVIVVQLGRDVINTLLQPLRTHKGIKFKTLLEKTCNYIGFQFETSISELDNIVYLPSNTNVDETGINGVLSKVATIEKGIPNASDAGYTCTELFQLCRELFNARYAISDGVVQFHSENSDYWVKQSNYVLRDIWKDNSTRSYRYNTEALKSSILLLFRTDIQDEYTIKNYQGTSYQVLTDAKAVNNMKNKTIKNLDRNDFQLALGNRKDEFSVIERILLPLAETFDRIASFFGASANLSNLIKRKIGVLQVSNNNHSIPKVLYMQGRRIPINHRELFSAKLLYNKYHSEKSFIANNYKKQRRIIEGQQIPFGLSDFVKLSKNSYFRDQNGSIGKVINIEWVVSKDVATIDYWIEEVYTTNLKETFIEPI